GQGGYVSSERVIITNLGNPCMQVGINQTNSEIPQKFALLQNYPNPFNPETKIKFQIPNAGFVKLAVYDAGGKLVKILVDENLNSGTYNIGWDASAYPSGVYFYILSSGSYKE